MPTYAKAIAVLLVLFGTLNIMATYNKLSHVFDEAPHVATGMQWWDQHRYTYEPLHPPLARIMTASLLYAAGKDESTTDTNLNYWFQGADILHSDHTYALNLILLRLGVLPFYLLSCLLVYRWSGQLFGEAAALLSLGLYVTLPTVAAHAGLGTTDMGNATMLMAGIMASLRWLKNPNVPNSLLAGVVLALMLATKFSAALFWPAAMLMITAANYLAGQKPARIFTIGARHIGLVAIIAFTFLFVLGAVYFFSLDALVQGFKDLYAKNKFGHATWLFHPLNNIGVWYYFPVVFLFKTPLTFLAASMFAGIRIAKRSGTIERWFPILAALAIFAVSMPSNINIGVRHVLGVYPLLAVPAGYGLLWLWQQRQVACKGLLVLFLIWQTTDFLRSYPDRLSYYNPIGLWVSDGEPERISFDSDVDWGQGFLQLADRIKQRNIHELYACFWLGGSVRRMGETLKLAPKHCPNGEVNGWVAVSRTEILLYPDKYRWLTHYPPTEKVGNTILLYHLD